MKNQASVEVKSERTFTLRRPTFKLFNNIEYLDTELLSKGSHSIELGRFEGGTCDCAVTADISDGMIKKLNYPKCEKATEISPALAKKLQAASKKLNPNGPPKWKDIPVAELSRSAGRAGIIVVVTGSDECYEVCIDPGNGLQTCWICCPGWCIGPSDPHLALF
jgi:hypothetical protein